MLRACLDAIAVESIKFDEFTCIDSSINRPSHTLRVRSDDVNHVRVNTDAFVVEKAQDE